MLPWMRREEPEEVEAFFFPLQFGVCALQDEDDEWFACIRLEVEANDPEDYNRYTLNCLIGPGYENKRDAVQNASDLLETAVVACRRKIVEFDE